MKKVVVATTFLKIRNKIEVALEDPVVCDKAQIKDMAFLLNGYQTSKVSTAPDLSCQLQVW